MATVILPLEQVYQLPFPLSPLSFVLDARRALSALGGKRQARDIHRDVGDVFRKQVEEAEWLVVNKIDLMSAEDLADLERRIAKEYAQKRTTPSKFHYVMFPRLSQIPSSHDAAPRENRADSHEEHRVPSPPSRRPPLC